MFKVFTGDGRQYVGCSESMANDFFDACVRSGRNVLMMKRVAEKKWIEVKEHVE